MTLANASELRALSRADIELLMQRGRLRFVIGERGGEQREIPPSDSRAFWRCEAHDRIADPKRVYVSSNSFAGEYGYKASEWTDGGGTPIVLLTVSG